MKSKLLLSITALGLLCFPTINFAQAPVLGTAADFVLFSSNGAVSNNGISQLTGNVGTNSGSSTFFGNVNGQMHDNDGASAQCATDLLSAYNQLNALIPTNFPAALLGNGQVLLPGIYSISSATTLNLDLTLDGQNNANSVFVFMIQGPLSTNANSKVKLINGALACNVFWKVEGLVDMAAGTTMRGTVIANNAAINMNTGDTLEGRALSTAGAVSVDGVLAYTPIGCNSPVHMGPNFPNLASSECYAIFSGDGSVTNAGITYVTGDIGTNVGLTTGYNALNVTGMIHPIPDVSTAQCAADLGTLYTYLNTLPYDIELLYPAQFGRNLVLTPHTYVMNAATVLTDTLFLSAEGNANAVFVIQINGALSTSTYAKVVLTNGTLAKNVFWKVDGAVDINDYTVFNGTIVCNNGAVNLTTGVTLVGRAFTTTGTLTTAATTVTMPPGCATTGLNIIEGSSETATVYPNPFSSSTNIKLNDASQINAYEMNIYNVLGEIVMSTMLTSSVTTIATSTLTTGMYFYKIIDKSGNMIQSGRMISQQ
ncbi:MAG: ice-binding family protein [Bacteroidota bacterium]|nr:ice-binding family protein [Bacteroidota bacterium]